MAKKRKKATMPKAKRRKAAKKRAARRSDNKQKLTRADHPPDLPSAYQQAVEELPPSIREAWERYASRMQAEGLDPHAPVIDEDDPQYSAAEEIQQEYAASFPAPIPFWEGEPLLEVPRGIEDVVQYLETQLRQVRHHCVGRSHDAFVGTGLQIGTETLSNLPRLLEHLGIDDRPELPKFGESPREVDAAIAVALAWARRESRSNDDWEGPQSPSEWAKRFGMSRSTFYKRRRAGAIRTKQDTTKSIFVHRDDLPNVS